MAPPREDLITSAITFLQDPSVATAPDDQKRSFFKSKGLTDEEIEIAQSRVGGGSQQYYAQQQGPPQGYGYNYGYQGQRGWAPQQQMQPPGRDWRDWFIMATVTTGLGWGLYTVAKRYIAPLVVPPTPPQLEKDKADIDASFTRAFDLIDQLASDTAALKEAETQRQEKLDTALAEMTAAVEELKQANKDRQEESRRLGDDVKGIRTMIPTALEGWKAQGDERVKELGVELKSLKTLLGSRAGSSVPPPPAAILPSVNGNGSSSAKSRTPPNGRSQDSTAPAAAPAAPAGSSGLNFGSGRSIPAWQKAAQAQTATVTEGDTEA